MYVHIHTLIGLDYLYTRLEKLQPDTQPLFGQMTCHQMICHIGDLFRMARGEMKALEYGSIPAAEIQAMAKAGKTIPAPRGFDQSKGEGTQPTEFYKDLEALKQLINEFNTFSPDKTFPPHPYFNTMSHAEWLALANYHINYHLEQFGV